MGFYKYIFVVLLFFSCMPKTPDQVIEAHRISNIFIRKMKVQENLDIQGKGGAMMYKIENLFFAFICQKTASQSDAHDLVVRCAKEFFDLVNSDAPIRPYLSTYPLPSSGLHLMISFVESCPDEFALTNQVDFVSLKDGVIRYWRNDFDIDQYVNIYKELYLVD